MAWDACSCLPLTCKLQKSGAINWQEPVQHMTYTKQILFRSLVASSSSILIFNSREKHPWSKRKNCDRKYASVSELVSLTQTSRVTRRWLGCDQRTRCLIVAQKKRRDGKKLCRGTSLSASGATKLIYSLNLESENVFGKMDDFLSATYLSAPTDNVFMMRGDKIS